MKRMITLAICMLTGMAAMAQKTVYIPNEWRNPWPSDSLLYKESDPDNKYTWSKSRSVESDNVIVFWDKYYGNTLPSKSPSAYRVDEQDLLQKCEAFYDLEINKLGFVDPQNSNVTKYKVMVLLNHTTDWVCYGGGYDYQISALWLGPSACKPVGSAVAHEVGHSFHYMCYAEHSGHTDSSTDNTGFHLACGNGQAIWEQTAQWQSLQSYPEEMYSQSISVFRKSHNYAFSHEWQRYQSYWFLYYLCEYYNDLTTVAQVWNTPMTGQSKGNATDFIQALMKLKNLDATGLFKLYYDYAAHCASWDMEACKPYRNAYIGDFEYRCIKIDEEKEAYQVALASAPQSSGFNVIPLQVPEAGTEITTHFTALRGTGTKLASGDPAEMLNGETAWTATKRTLYVTNSNRSYRGFRLGYVALMKDGTRQYFNEDQLYCTGTDVKTEDVKMTVPEGVERLWLIVVPAPKKYVQHKWTEKVDNAEMWPYSFELEGTRLGTKATVYEPTVAPVIDGRAISDVTLTYDVYFPASSTTYPGVTFNITGKANATLGTAFQMNASEIAGKMQAYSASGPSAGKIMFYPCNPKTGKTVNNKSTANGYGHWFNASGTVSDYGSGYVYSEADLSTLAFTLGQYPGKSSNGKTYTISQALVYKKSATETATARFVFNVHLAAGDAYAQLSSIEYDDPTGIEDIMIPNDPKGRTNNKIYDLQGRQVVAPSRPGIYIVNGKKIKL
ncbi:MAG: DUF4859 domain-containing protein [Bacteroidaceae bacterium]|nr:DUF4859 domain-containing protein [Bacteroidaceae bacterium]